MDFLQRMQQNIPYCSRYTDMPSQLQQKAKTLCWQYNQTGPHQQQERAQDKRVTLAFLTAAREYVFEGYEVQAVRYLLKPMQQEKVFELLDLARQNLQEQPSLILNCADEKKKLYLSQIAAIEAQGHYLIFHTTTGQLQQKASLSSLAGHLGDSFVMSHRSFYVNLAHLLRISRTECTLDTGLTVPVSRGAYKNLNEQFIRYYRKEMLE